MILETYKTKRKTKDGLTLIETLVAIGILSLSIAGPLTLSARGLVFARYAKDEITAFYLAQEGVEIARNLRDENIRSGRPWLSGLDGLSDSSDCLFPNKCQIDIWTIGDPAAAFLGWDRGLKKCPVSGCQPLNLLYNSDGVKTYGHDFNMAGQCILGNNCRKTFFERYVSIKPQNYRSDPSFKDEVEISVTVKWQRGVVSRDLVINETLFNF